MAQRRRPCVYHGHVEPYRSSLAGPELLLGIRSGTLRALFISLWRLYLGFRVSQNWPCHNPLMDTQHGTVGACVGMF